MDQLGLEGLEEVGTGNGDSHVTSHVTIAEALDTMLTEHLGILGAAGADDVQEGTLPGGDLTGHTNGNGDSVPPDHSPCSPPDHTSFPTDEEVGRLWTEHYNSYYWYCYQMFCQSATAGGDGEGEVEEGVGDLMDEGTNGEGVEELGEVGNGEEFGGGGGGGEYGNGGGEEIKEEEGMMEGDVELEEGVEGECWDDGGMAEAEGEYAGCDDGMVESEGECAGHGDDGGVEAEGECAGHNDDGVLVEGGAEEGVVGELIEEMVGCVVSEVVTAAFGDVPHHDGDICVSEETGGDEGVAGGGKRWGYSGVEDKQQLECRR